MAPRSIYDKQYIIIDNPNMIYVLNIVVLQFAMFDNQMVDDLLLLTILFPFFYVSS